NKAFVQRLKLQAKLPVHKGCVNTICWNESGQWLLSGSDDQHLCITHAYTHKKLVYLRTGHRANIFSAKFLPNTGDRLVVSCSGDGMIVFTEIERPETSLCNIFNCHYGTAYEVTTVPNDPHTFLSCGEDGTVRWFDLRIKNKCSINDCKDDILIKCKDAVTALAVNHLTPYLLGVGCADSYVRIYDRRMLGTKALGSLAGNGVQSVITRFTVPELESKSHRITSLSYSPDAQEMLVSYSSDYIYLFNTKDIDNNRTVAPTTLQKASAALKSSTKPLVRRLRVRGDWSDTGPNARPETERGNLSVESESSNEREQLNSSGESRRPLHSNLMQRMSDVLNRIFNATSRRRARASEGDSTDEAFIEAATASNRSRSQSQEEIRTTRSDTSTNDVQHQHEHEHLGSTSSSNATSDGRTAQAAQEVKNPTDVVVEQSDREPVVNLQYSGQGLNSGIITVESTEPGASSSEVVDTTSVMYFNDLSSSNEQSRASSRSPAARSVHTTGASEENDSFVMEIQEWDDYEDRDVEDSSPATGFGDEEMRDDGRRSRRSLHSDEQRDSDNSAQNETESNVSGGGRTRNPRDLLIRSFDDVLKHFREARDQEKIQFASISMPKIKKKYSGHRNARTMIKESTFWGDNFVMSGSDCGHIFIWDRITAELVMIMEADRHVVNCLQPHPFDPILASSGIDSDIKIWAPLKDEAFFDDVKAQEVIRINEIMLEETMDTITVPASFMIRMLSSLNQLRSRGEYRF
ncbi:nuclear receptor interaction protein-like protein, partial [Dinothrombium tinctorium]